MPHMNIECNPIVAELCEVFVCVCLGAVAWRLYDTYGFQRGY